MSELKEIQTNDGSITFYSEEYKETYHSVSGAFEEALKKFIEPCRVKEYEEMKILDIGFGLGYNVVTALNIFNGKKIEIISLEKDKLVLQKLHKLNPNVNNYDKIKKVAKEFVYEDDKIKLKIILGDAIETIKRQGSDFNAVFLDPFSPKKNPELWTEQFFKELYKRMKPGAVLATYSCAKVVRENLAKAGFIVKDGPVVGRKSPATIAFKE